MEKLNFSLRYMGILDRIRSVYSGYIFFRKYTRAARTFLRL